MFVSRRLCSGIFLRREAILDAARDMQEAQGRCGAMLFIRRLRQGFPLRSVFFQMPASPGLLQERPAGGIWGLQNLGIAARLVSDTNADLIVRAAVATFPGVLDPCSQGCTSLTTCVGGRCVYGTEALHATLVLRSRVSAACAARRPRERAAGRAGKGVSECRARLQPDVDLELFVGRRGSAPVAQMGSRANLISSAHLGFCARVRRKSAGRSSCCAGRMSRFQFRLGLGRASGIMIVLTYSRKDIGFLRRTVLTVFAFQRASVLRAMHP